MLDSDLANLYHVETRRINEAVFRNKEKFPERFTWTLSKKELENNKKKEKLIKEERDEWNYREKRN